jgi:hypothetical protein
MKTAIFPHIIHTYFYMILTVQSDYLSELSLFARIKVIVYFAVGKEFMNII